MCTLAKKKKKKIEEKKLALCLIMATNITIGSTTIMTTSAAKKKKKSRSLNSTAAQHKDSKATYMPNARNSKATQYKVLYGYLIQASC